MNTKFRNMFSVLGVAALTFAVAACENDTPAQPGPGDLPTVPVDDEDCGNGEGQNGEPCK